MELPAAGREYCRWRVTGAPDGLSYEAQFTKPDGTVSAWLAVETVSATEVRALIAGPDVTQAPAIIALPVGKTHVKIRCTDTPEIIVRGGGRIDVG